MIPERVAAMHRARDDSAKSSTLAQEPGDEEGDEELSGEKSAYHAQ
ncbi:MAG TPA: hypothetical protein VGJ62_06255 [Gemmatimonadaceae bacterium]